MASILPDDPILDDIYEGEFSSVKFNYELDSGDSFISMSIDAKFPNNIEINQSGYSGEFNNLFELPKGSLKYVIGETIGEANKFIDLPPKGTADLYSFEAPKVMLKNFDVNVTLTYNSNGEEINITKQYIQPIRGNWSTFKTQFLNYVR